MPQTSQTWWSDDAAADERGAGGGAAAEAEGGAEDELVLEGGRADANDEEAGAHTDAAGEGEGGGGEVDNDGEVAEVDVPFAALGGFPSFSFVMGWCGGVLEVRWAVAGASTASVQRGAVRMIG